MQKSNSGVNYTYDSYAVSRITNSK